MKIGIHIIIIFCLSVATLFCQYTQQGIDTVYSFTPGTGQNAGQAPEYYPENIFGLPFKNASLWVPVSSPEHILSIGMGGEIIIGFKDKKIINGPGPDFTIFENVFINPVTNKPFVEPAKVAVSQDGIHYYEFPFDSTTLVGCAGITPTYGNYDPFNPEESGGDSFDIEDLGLDYITHIKITDICQMLLDNPDHYYYDPIITGFDLDAVVGLYLYEGFSTIENDIFNDVHIKNSNYYFEITNNSQNKIRYKLYSITGIELQRGVVENTLIFNKFNLNSGLYLVYLFNKNAFYVEKFLVY